MNGFATSFAVLTSLSISLSGALLSRPAQAADMCAAPGFQSLRATLAAQNSVPGVQTTPAIAYRGLNGEQLVANKRAGLAESQYTSATFNRLARAAKTFIESNGNTGATASIVFGDVDRRESVQIYKRPLDDSSTAASPSVRCSASSCADMALEVIALHVLPNRHARDVIDLVTASKLATFGSAQSLYCPTGAGCTSRSDLGAANSVVKRSSNPSPLPLNEPYTVREVVSASILGKIDNTSVYKVVPLAVCGHLAFLLTGVSTRDQNSFSSSSSDVLVVEAGGKVLALTIAQGIAPKGSQVPGIFLNSFFGGKALKTLVSGYNDQAKRFGEPERIDSGGRLQN